MEEDADVYAPFVERLGIRLAASGAAAAHCPLMNAVRGHIAPVEHFLRRGVPVALGMDNMLADYFDVMRAGILVARIRAHDARSLLTPQALALATRGGRAGARARAGDRIDRGRQARRARLPGVRPHTGPRPGAEPRPSRPGARRGDGLGRRARRGRRRAAGACGRRCPRGRGPGGGGRRLGALRGQVRRHHGAVRPRAPAPTARRGPARRLPRRRRRCGPWPLRAGSRLRAGRCPSRGGADGVRGAVTLT
jgi:hypothetical protein